MTAPSFADATPFFSESKKMACVHAQSLSGIRLFVTPWTVILPASLSMGISRQEYWSGLTFPSPQNLPDPGTEPTSPESPALASGFFTIESPGKL